MTTTGLDGINNGFMSTIEIGAAALQDHPGVESAEPNGMLLEGPRVLWRPREEFRPELIGSALAARAKDTVHPSHGPGFTWELATDPLSPTRLELYPACRLVKIRFVDGSMECQTREYTVHSIATTSATRAVLITSARGDRATVVNVHPSGDIDEFHRRFDKLTPVGALASNRVVRTVEGVAASAGRDLAERPPFTVREAAKIIGCHPSNIRHLIRRGRLPHIKRGWQLFVDAQAVESYQRSNRRRSR